MNLIALGSLIAGLGLICLLVIAKSYLRRHEISKVDKVIFWISIVLAIVGIIVFCVGAMTIVQVMI